MKKMKFAALAGVLAAGKFFTTNFMTMGVAEIITQLGFYAGWPKAWAAFNMAKEVYAEQAQ